MNNKPYVFPYQLLQFWIRAADENNHSIKNYNTLNNAAYGTIWHSFELEITNQATTRKRLLVQGSTTYETIDSETSQNLLLLTDTTTSNSPKIIWPSEYQPSGHKSKGRDP
jgi:hypothetical protein